ncbi:MAG: TolC family protein, partial [Bacteroidota bacterium]|nr:TolC family protein [Bacteroidota bacterium]
MMKIIHVYLTFLVAFPLLTEAFIQAQTLDDYIQAGLKNSPLLKDYSNRIDISTLDSLSVKAVQMPQVSANAQILYAPSYRNFGYDEAITNGGNYSSVVSISQPFFNRKNLANQYENLNIQKRSVANATKISTADLKRTITDQYLTAYTDYSELEFNKKFLKIIYEERDILRQLVEQGIYKQTDFLSFTIETQTQEMLIQQLDNQLKKDILGLNQICGITDTARAVLSLPEIGQATLTNLQTSPLFIQFKIDSLKIENSKQAVNLRYLPKLSWFADAGLNSSTLSSAYQHFGYSAGLNFSIPIFDGNQKKLDYQKLAISENTRANYESFFKAQYSQQIMQLSNEFNSTRQMAIQLKKQLHTAEELISLSRLQLSSGNISI